jgi:16S rRNA processing protein RimM
VSREAEGEILLGFIAGVSGVRGWIKIHSYTDPRDNVVAHRQWTLRQGTESRRVHVTGGHAHGKTVVAKLEGFDERDTAAALVGAEIFVPRSELPACEPREYYWTDLEGMTVCDPAGRVIGRVDHLIETGAHDVLVLTGTPQRLIPFVLDRIVTDVDLQSGTITVSWDANFWDE